MNDHCLFCYQLLFLIFRIDEYLHVLLHGIFYPFISANKAFRLRSGFTWSSYCLICMFLSNVLLTIVLRFVLFTLAIVMSVCLRITAGNNPLYIFSSFSYLWVPCFSNYLGKQFLTKDKIRKNEHKWLID